VALSVAGTTPPGSARQPVSPEWSRKVAQSESLIAKARQLAPNAHPDDRREIERLIEQVRHGLSAGADEELTAALAELEDLVFYLKDA